MKNKEEIKLQIESMQKELEQGFCPAEFEKAIKAQIRIFNWVIN